MNANNRSRGIAFILSSTFKSSARRLRLVERERRRGNAHPFKELGIEVFAVLEVVGRDGQVALGGRQAGDAKAALLVGARRAHEA